ncbi:MULTISPECIES: hypothetical protein [Vibrio]|uniref:hypothetical protein n=1 Tax=Vibrio TaxID=662 RepID=UPI0005710A7D|nr:hypothetical protein [Vibrio pacinii]
MRLLKISNIVNLLIISLLPSISLAQSSSPSLTIRTISGLSSATIYANGNMQAKLLVSYKNIPQDYTVEKLSIREAYTNNPLPSSWENSSIDNGYDSDISGYRSAEKNKTVQNSTSQIFYLSTRNSDNNITLCAELVASNANGNRETLTTCNGDVNSGLVYLNVVPEINYGIEDLDQVTSREWYENDSYAIAQERFTLKNNREIRGVGGCDTKHENNGKRYLISSTNGPEHPYSGNRKYGAAYLFEPVRGVVSTSFPYFGITVNLITFREEFVEKETETLKFNTTNSITFAWLNGQDNLHTYINPLINIEIHCPLVTFVDNYGNNGIINISRHSNPNDKWGKVYYRFH